MSKNDAVPGFSSAPERSQDLGQGQDTAPSCADFHPQEIEALLQAHPLLKGGFTSTWQGSDGYAAALTAGNLLQKPLESLKARYSIYWTFIARPRKEGENNSFTNLCFDPNYYADYWRGLRLSVDDLAPQRRVYLLTEVCGKVYLTDLSPLSVYRDAYTFQPLEPSMSFALMKEALEYYFGREASRPSEITFGSQLFTPLERISEEHPYRRSTLMEVYHPQNERSTYETSAKATRLIMKLRRIFGICPI